MSILPTQLSPTITRDALRELARELNIAGRGKMTRDELFIAVSAALPTRAPAQVKRLTARQRCRNYLRQTGRIELTPRQRRRANKKLAKHLGSVAS